MGSEAERLTHQELTLLAEAASDVTFTGDLNGVTGWVSSGVVNLVGWAPDEMVGRPFFDFVHPDDQQAVTDGRATADATGTVRFRARVRRRDGSYRWVDVLLRTRCDAAGEPLGRFGSWRDADEEVHLKAALEEELRVTARYAKRLRATLDSMLDPHVLLEAVRDDVGTIVDFVFVDANTAAAEFNGVSLEELIGVRLLGKHPAAAATTLFEDYVHLVETGEPLIRDDWSYPQDMLDGEIRRYDVRAAKIGDGLSQTWRDVTDRYEATHRIAESEEHFRLLAHNASEMVALLRDRKIVWASPSTIAALGRDPDSVIGTEVRDNVVSEDLDRYDEAYAAAEAGQTRIVRLRLRGPHGNPHWLEVHIGPYRNPDGSLGAVLTSSRIIDDLMAAEQELKRQARFDLLTGLMNRPEFHRNLARVSAQRPRVGGQTAILFCDIDRFKDINDAHGHAAGDEVLRTLGERLSATIRSDDFAARIGGDELVVVLADVDNLDEAVTIAEKIRTTTSKAIALKGGARITPSLSIGVTLARPGETTTPSSTEPTRRCTRPRAPDRATSAPSGDEAKDQTDDVASLTFPGACLGLERPLAGRCLATISASARAPLHQEGLRHAADRPNRGIEHHR